MQRYVVALALAAGLVFGGSAAGAVGGVPSAGQGRSSAPVASMVVPRPAVARGPIPTVGEPPMTVLGPPSPTLVFDPAPLLDPFWTSPAVALLGPLHLPGVGSPSRRGGRPLIDLANRPRTGRKFPRVPTAVPGGQGDPFAALPSGGYGAYGTGTAYHTDADLSGDRGSDIDLGFAGAAYTSTPVLARFDELNHRVAPPLKASSGYGQGDAADVGALDQPGGGGGPDISTRAEASAPPTQAPRSEDQSDVTASPFIDADVLHAEAGARSAIAGCVVGSDLVYGLGSATDTKALATGAGESAVSTDGEGPRRAVSQTVTRSRLVPRTGTDRFGLLTETRQTIAPTTIRRGTPDEMTVEVAGEWILTVMVDGAKSRLDYGPDVDPQTTVLRVTRPEHPGKGNGGKTVEVANVTAQQLMGADGQVLDLGTAELVVGELPRGIRDDHGSFPLRTVTRVAAATDVVRIQLKDMPGADLRIGHMEAAAAVPAEGIACPGIGMAKNLDSSSVRPGDRFTWAIDVSNANDCVLDKVNVLDTITATPGVRYHVVSSDPPAKMLTDGSVRFEGIGPLRQGESRRLLIDGAVDDISAPGSLHDVAVADGACGPDRRANQSSADSDNVAAPVPMSGRAELNGPAVGALRLAGGLPPVTAASPSERASTALAGAPTRAQAGASKSAAAATAAAVVERQRVPLARTGGVLSIVPAWMMISGGSVLRRVRRRRV